MTDRSQRGGLVVVACGSSEVDRDCARDAARLVQAALPEHLVLLAGPGADTALTDELIAQSALYVQPGGGELEPAYQLLAGYAETLRRHILHGGGYLGLCLGGYLAGKTPGFGLLPGDTDQYIASAGAEVRHTRDCLVTVSWGGRRRRMFFQDGPMFEVTESKVDVLARYHNGTIAALASDLGHGRVAVCGPHPEATRQWFRAIRGWQRYTDSSDLGHELVRAALPRTHLNNAAQR